jgi:hypothetical protein
LNLNDIVIIGTGTLGGHLCKHLAESSQVSKLTLIDKDIVDTKDTMMGVFQLVDLAEPKVYALKHMFINHHVEIESRAELYIDGITELPKSDLIIDCRNMFGRRDLSIDMKMFISGRFLILDFQKEEKWGTPKKGEYIIELKKHEINRAAYYAKDLICSDVLPELLKSRSIKYIDIDIIQSVMLKNINLTKDKPDMIYEINNDINRLSRVEEIVTPILNKNKETSLKIVVEKRSPLVQQVFDMPKKAETEYKIIPQNKLQTPEQVIELLGEAIKGRDKTMRFLPVIINNEIHILQELGGA